MKVAGNMKIQLIKPTRLDENKRPIKYRKALLPPLPLAVLDRLTPERHHVKIVDDIVEDIDYSSSYDLVGISAMTVQAERAYQVANRFREMGVKVILGGIHPSVLPHEAIKHADSVVIGEAERLWEQILADFENNRFKEFYQDTSRSSLRELIIPKWDNVNMKIYVKQIGRKRPHMPVFTTRGCPFTCTYCTVTGIFGKTFRTKPIANVIKEIDSLDNKNYLFADDNIAGDFDYSRELFKALIPKKISWLSQISTTVLKSPDLIELAGRSGCELMLFGTESINKKSLKSVNKGFNNPEAYVELFARTRKAGIIPCPTIMFGFDEDTLDQFRLTMEFLEKNKLETALFAILTPFPGTKVYEDMKEAGRILTYNWSMYDFAHVVFQPKNFTADELKTGFWETYRELLSFKSMTKRLFYITSRSRRPFTDFYKSLLYMFCNRVNVYSNNQAVSNGVIRVKSKEGT
jgi:radical SAM superfamily enzyme YgiQ (UPF0313 family)